MLIKLCIIVVDMTITKQKIIAMETKTYEARQSHDN